MSVKTVQLYLKAPVPGTVKTRLAATLGADKATAIYRRLAGRQLDARPRDWPLEVLFAPADAEEAMREWLGDVNLVPQSDGTLGDRLARGVGGGIERGADLVFAAGADCPELQAAHFQQAGEFLEAGADAVFAPAEDGGFTMVALKRPSPELFADVPWSTGQTLSVCLTRARDLGLRTALLRRMFDVDEEADWRRAVDEGLLEG